MSLFSLTRRNVPVDPDVAPAASNPGRPMSRLTETFSQALDSIRSARAYHATECVQREGLDQQSCHQPPDRFRSQFRVSEGPNS
jgi:hypothetical protein